MYCIRIYRDGFIPEVLAISEDEAQIDLVHEKLCVWLDSACRMRDSAEHGVKDAAVMLEKMAAKSPTHRRIVEELSIGYQILGMGEYEEPPTLEDSGLLALLPKRRGKRKVST